MEIVSTSREIVTTVVIRYTMEDIESIIRSKLGCYIDIEWITDDCGDIAGAEIKTKSYENLNS